MDCAVIDSALRFARTETRAASPGAQSNPVLRPAMKFLALRNPNER